MQVIAPEGLLDVGEERMGMVKRGVAVGVDIVTRLGNIFGVWRRIDEEYL